MEIYIPVEAEVKSIFLGTLPKSVFKHIECESTSKLAESPVGIWICPVVLRKKGQKQTSQPESSKEQHLSWPTDMALGPCRMSFVSRNHTAYNVLKETMPGPKSPTHISDTLKLTPCSAAQTNESAVIIYQRHIYLKVKKNSHQGIVDGHSVPSTSDLSSQNVEKRQSHQASLGSEGNEPHRKRLRITVSEMSHKQLENPLTNSHNTNQVLCVRVCIFYSALCLAGRPLSSEAATLRCGSDLLSDLIFVCGDRGIYLGKGTWSGYGARPRGKGIVDQCCRPAGCKLQYLEMYCAKPKNEQYTTAYPTITTTALTATQMDTEQQFQAVFQKRLLKHLGPPNSPKREAFRKKAQSSLRWKNKLSSSRRKMILQSSTRSPPSVSGSTPTNRES